MERAAQFKNLQRPASLRRRREPALLADALVSLMGAGQAGVAKRYEMVGTLSEVWAQLLPTELEQHCRVIDLSAGRLTVEADSPSYLYELRLSNRQLVEHLRQNCPAAKVRTLRVVLAR